MHPIYTTEQIDVDGTPLRMGKYKGRTPRAIAKFDPAYICWLNKKIFPKVTTKTLYECCANQQFEENHEYPEMPPELCGWGSN